MITAEYVCEEGWKLFERSCFKFTGQLVTALEANNECTRQQAFLAYLDTPQVQSWISRK